MLRFIKYFLVFILLITFQIYFEGNISVRPIVNLGLLFLVWFFFILPWPSLVSFAVLTGVIFDTFSSFNWGINIVSFIFILLIGWLLVKIFEIKSFWSRLLIGESMISSYFIILFLGALIFAHLNLIWLILREIFINSLIYLGLMGVLNYRILYEFKKKHH